MSWKTMIQDLLASLQITTPCRHLHTRLCIPLSFALHTLFIHLNHSQSTSSSLHIYTCDLSFSLSLIQYFLQSIKPACDVPCVSPQIIAIQFSPLIELMGSFLDSMITQRLIAQQNRQWHEARLSGQQQMASSYYTQSIALSRSAGTVLQTSFGRIFFIFQQICSTGNFRAHFFYT